MYNLTLLLLHSTPSGAYLDTTSTCNHWGDELKQFHLRDNQNYNELCIDLQCGTNITIHQKNGFNADFDVSSYYRRSVPMIQNTFAVVEPSELEIEETQPDYGHNHWFGKGCLARDVVES